jgi:prepilin-type N-terminal cleavage/methylation domain-containing protein
MRMMASGADISGSKQNSQHGFTLLELMIAVLVLAVGLTGGLMLVLTAMANDSRSKTDSTATVLSQMTLEMIASVPGNSTATVSINDCSGTGHTVSTTGSGTGAGASLTSGGAIDFTSATVGNYSMTFATCAASTGDRQANYDIRWYIKTLSPNAKLVIVGARISNADTNQSVRFAVPVTLKMIVGL